MAVSEDAHLITLAQTGEDQPKPKASQLDAELGVPMSMPFSVPSLLAGAGTSATEQAQLLLRRSEISVRQLMDMRNKDGQARALYRLMTLPIRAALGTATYVPADNDNGEAEFIEQMMTLPPNAGGMVVMLHRFIAQLLMALFDGFSAFELVYWQPTKGPLAGKYTLKKAAYRPSDTVYFKVGDHGEYEGFHQRTVYQGKVVDVDIEAGDSLYYAANEEENPFYGQSYFTSAFYHYDKKVKLYYLAHLAAQHRAVGTRLGKIPANANTREKEAFRRALSDFGLAQAMLVPDGYSVESLQNQGQAFDYVAMIQHHDDQMAKSVLAQWIDKQAPRLVDFSSAQDDMFLIMLHTIMDEIAALLNNYLFPKFIDWNFATGAYPEFRWGQFTDEQKAAVRTVFQALAIAQSTNVSEDFMYELEKLMADELGLEIDYTEMDKQHEEQKKLENDLKEQQLQNQLDLAKQGPQPPAPPGPPGAGGGAPPAANGARPPTRPPAAGGGQGTAKATPAAPAPASKATAAAPASTVKATGTRATLDTAPALISLSDIAREMVALDLAGEGNDDADAGSD